jgi:hypothetical protein
MVPLYFVLAAALVSLEVLFYLLVGLPWLLWEKLSYTAQCLRYPPPPGGMYGNMLRHYLEKGEAEKR